MTPKLNHSKIFDWLEIIRPEHLFSAISNCWLIVLLSAEIESQTNQNQTLLQMPLALGLFIATIIPAGLGICGICFNDILDLKHDRTFRPASPIAAGRVSVNMAATLALASLLVAIAAASTLGFNSTLLCIMTAGAILFFNVCGKYLPATRLISMGLIRAMTMLICVPRMGFAWPVCMTMTHIVFCMALVYAVAGKRPRLRPTDLAQLAAGTLFWAVLLVMFMISRQTVLLHHYPSIWIGPLTALIIFIILSTVYLKPRLSDLRSRRQTAGRYEKLAMFWLIVYDVSWLLSVGKWSDALIIAGLGVMAGFIMILLSLRKNLPQLASPYRVEE